MYTVAYLFMNGWEGIIFRNTLETSIKEIQYIEVVAPHMKKATEEINFNETSLDRHILSFHSTDVFMYACHTYRYCSEDYLLICFWLFYYNKVILL